MAEQEDTTTDEATEAAAEATPEAAAEDTTQAVAADAPAEAAEPAEPQEALSPKERRVVEPRLVPCVRLPGASRHTVVRRIQHVPIGPHTVTHVIRQQPPAEWRGQVRSCRDWGRVHGLAECRASRERF